MFAKLCRFVSLAAILASPLVAATSPAEPISEPDEVLAVYDGGTVTRVEYESWLLFIGKKEEPEKQVDRIATIALHESLAEKAKQMGLGASAVSRMAVVDLESRLWHRQLRRFWAGGIEVGEQELAAAVEARKDAFYRPRRVRLYNLLKRFPKNGGEQELTTLRQAMQTLHHALVEGADFEKLARRESESQTRFRGGLIGWVRPGDLAADIEKIAMALEPGQLSSVLTTEEGLTILWCKEVEDEQRPSLGQIRDRVEKNLRQERLAELWKKLEDGAAAIEIDLDAARSAGDKTVAELPGGRTWSGADVAALLQARNIRRSAAELPALRLESVLRQVFEEVLAADRARALKLEPTPEMRSELHWAPLTILSTEWIKNQLEQRFEPLTKEEIRAYYEAHRERYHRPAQTHLEVIAIPAERSELRRLYQQGEQIAEDLRQGRLSFADAARRYSKHSSAERGGVVGWLERKQIAAMGPNVLATVDELDDGEISGLVQQPEGMAGASNLWILRRIGSRPAKALTFEEAARAAENGLGNEKTRALQAEIHREVLSNLRLRLLSEAAANTAADAAPDHS